MSPVIFFYPKFNEFGVGVLVHDVTAQSKLDQFPIEEQSGFSNESGVFRLTKKTKGLKYAAFTNAV